MHTCIWLNLTVALGNEEGLYVLGKGGSLYPEDKEGLREVVV